MHRAAALAAVAGLLLGATLAGLCVTAPMALRYHATGPEAGGTAAEACAALDAWYAAAAQALVAAGFVSITAGYVALRRVGQGVVTLSYDLPFLVHRPGGAGDVCMVFSGSGCGGRTTSGHVDRARVERRVLRVGALANAGCGPAQS